MSPNSAAVAEPEPTRHSLVGAGVAATRSVAQSSSARALITGVSGQDGSYLAEALIADGVEVHGVVQEPVAIDGVEVHALDLSEPGIGQLITALKPDVVFNLAAVSSVYQSWQHPELTARINGLAVAEMLAALHSIDGARFVQASSAEIFGMPTETPQTESTPVRPSSPYGAAKAYAHGLVGVYRGAGMLASSCILYNHESPRRPETFVTRKITAAAARIALGQQDRLELGNLAARRDWGWAPDYVGALLAASRASVARDYVIATGETHSVEDFVRLAFARAGIDDWRAVVSVDEGLLRAGDAPEQRGDASLARRELGWEPTVDFEELVAAMVDADLALARRFDVRRYGRRAAGGRADAACSRAGAASRETAASRGGGQACASRARWPQSLRRETRAEDCHGRAQAGGTGVGRQAPWAARCSAGGCEPGCRRGGGACARRLQHPDLVAGDRGAGGSHDARAGRRTAPDRRPRPGAGGARGRQRRRQDDAHGGDREHEHADCAVPGARARLPAAAADDPRR